MFQEVSLSLWERFPDYDPAQPFLPWALGIARHKALHAWRRQRRLMPVLSSQALAALEPVWTAGVEVLDDEALALERCLKQVDERTRKLLDLRYRDDLPLADIAERSGSSLEAVTKLLARVRYRLAACIRNRTGRPA